MATIPIRVLHVLRSNTFSGAENVVCQIISMFSEDERYEMAYCSPNGPISTALEERNITYYPLNRLSKNEVRKAIEKFKPSLIHAHDIAASVMCSLSNNVIPIIAHVHGNHMNMRKLTFKSFAFYAISRSLKQIIWVSKSAKDDYVFRKKVEQISIVLPNVIQKEYIYKKALEAGKSKQYDCIVLGRINAIKNPLKALRIFKMVKDEIPHLRVVFVGDGNLRNECVTYINNNSLQSNIDMVGYMDNPMGILSNSKILVMTSIYEGTPMSALEAMAFGIPIVSTPTDGIVDLVLQEKTGICDDREEILSKSIIKLLTNKELYNTMKENTFNRFDELMDLKHYASVLDEIYTK